ncbi:MAG: cupredoxin family copper-binding protein [Candidatus Burarchaeum sp.]|nr:cupredoxin family copper-binding protein [Candidatus Burarchaeum sp.]MDO8339094.1 cupredoxin family copper-binding protein [Candidatus Burarchaeum sp.]
MSETTRLMVAIIPMILFIALIAGCSQQYGTQPAQQPPSSTPPANQPPAGTPPSTTPPATTPPAASTAVVSIKNFAFDPAELTVAKGTKVTWTNEDAAPHRLDFDAFSSENLNTGQTYEFTFNDAGTFDYICGLHPTMKGKIIVQ